MAMSGDIQARRMLDAFEARYAERIMSTREASLAMAHAAHDGRATQGRDARVVAVNGQEVRSGERWHSTPMQTRHCATITVSTRRRRERGTDAAVAAALGGGRQWHLFNARATQTDAKRDAGTVYAQRLAALGAVGNTPDA
jgi:hypothetical protein